MLALGNEAAAAEDKKDEAAAAGDNQLEDTAAGEDRRGKKAGDSRRHQGNLEGVAEGGILDSLEGVVELDNLVGAFVGEGNLVVGSDLDSP